MSKKLFFIVFSVALGIIWSPLAHAQVVVTPTQVPDNSRQIFTVNVPSSRPPHSTTALKLFLPAELTNVIPDVKSGWKVTLKNKLTASTTIPTEVDWTLGSIPAGEGDTFQFSANVPSGSSDLVWRAYQTYSDGVVISWDQTPSANAPVGTSTATLFGSYSETAVVGDESVTDAFTNPGSLSNPSSTSFDISIIALILSAMAVFIAWRSRLR